MTTKLDNEKVLQLWLSQPSFKGHFFVERQIDHPEILMVTCKCPSWNRGVYSGIAFFWVQDTDVLARPKSFFLDSMPPRKLTNLGDPACFTLMEERLEPLHNWFKLNRQEGL